MYYPFIFRLSFLRTANPPCSKSSSCRQLFQTSAPVNQSFSNTKQLKGGCVCEVCYGALMETKNKTKLNDPSHSTILNRIRRRALDLVENGRLTPQELQIIFELETQIQERVNKLQKHAQTPDKCQHSDEIEQTNNDTSTLPNHSLNLSQPAEHTQLNPYSSSLSNAPIPSEVTPRQSATIRNPGMQHNRSKSRSNIQHNQQTEAMPRQCFGQITNKPAWPIPPPKRAPYNPAFSVKQAIPAPRRYPTK